MKNFTILETVNAGRSWISPADTAHAALDRFREGKAQFQYDLPGGKVALVNVTVMDPETGQCFTEEALDAEMNDMVSGPYSTVDELAEALNIDRSPLVEALTIPPPAESDIITAAFDALTEALNDNDEPKATHRVTVVIKHTITIDVTAADRSMAYDDATERLTQSSDPTKDFPVELYDWEVATVEKL